MPLCIITGVTPLNTTYYIVFTFLLSETINDYCWVLGIMKKLYKFLDIPNPKVIIINIHFSIIYIILEELSLAFHLLYIWYINKNVITNCKKLFVAKESWEKFYEE